MGSLFTIRSTLKKRTDMSKIIVFSYILVLFLFITNGLSFLFTYGESGVKNLPFDNFPGDYVIYTFKWLFYLTLPATLLIFIIANCHELEYEKLVNQRITNENGQIQVKRLIPFRLILTSLMLVPVFFIEDEYNLSVVSGILVVPFIGFILPILLDYIYFYKIRSF